MYWKGRVMETAGLEKASRFCERRVILVVLLLAFLLRFMTACYYEESSKRLHYIGYDESVYYSLAHHMVKTSPFTYTLQDAPLFFQGYRIWYIDLPLFIHPPLFVATLALLHIFAGEEFFIIRFLNVVLGTASVYVTYLLGRRFSEKVGTLSALFLSLSPLHIQMSGFVLMEMMLALLVSLYLLCSARVMERGDRRAILWSGIVCGLGGITKYTFFLVLVSSIGYVMTRRVKKTDLVKIVGIGLFPFSFWIAWNMKTYGMEDLLNVWGMINKFGNPSNVPFYSYVSFLPVVAPFTLLSFASLFTRKSGQTQAVQLRTALLLTFASYAVFHMAHPIRDMRFILPVLPPLSVVGSEFLLTLKPKLSLKILLATILASCYASYIVVHGGYNWYLDFWHYEDWYIHFFGFLK